MVLSSRAPACDATGIFSSGAPAMLAAEQRRGPRGLAGSASQGASSS